MTFNRLWNGDSWFIVHGIKSRLISSIVAVEAASVASAYSIDCASKFRVAEVKRFTVEEYHRLAAI